MEGTVSVSVSVLLFFLRGGVGEIRGLFALDGRQGLAYNSSDAPLTARERRRVNPPMAIVNRPVTLDADDGLKHVEAVVLTESPSGLLWVSFPGQMFLGHVGGMPLWKRGDDPAEVYRAYATGDQVTVRPR